MTSPFTNNCRQIHAQPRDNERQQAEVKCALAQLQLELTRLKQEWHELDRAECRALLADLRYKLNRGSYYG
jgi:hypothetical protein